MSDLTDRLTKIKEKIERAKEAQAKLQGAIEQEIKQLSEEFGLNNIKDAEKALDKMEEELDTMENSLEKGIKKLEGMIP